MKAKRGTDRAAAAKIARGMRQNATEHGVWHEVRAEYLYERNRGECVSQAAFYAQYEWDV
jgi:hypothetical protein